MFKQLDKDSEAEVESGVFFLHDVISHKTTFCILFTLIIIIMKRVNFAGFLTHCFQTVNKQHNS